MESTLESTLGSGLVMFFAPGSTGEDAGGCGFVLYTVVPALRIAEIRVLYVAPAFRRMGVARELLLQVEHDVAREHANISLIAAEVGPDALVAFRRAGYVDSTEAAQHARD